jgi:hypothetical protein
VDHVNLRRRGIDLIHHRDGKIVQPDIFAMGDARGVSLGDLVMGSASHIHAD